MLRSFWQSIFQFMSAEVSLKISWKSTEKLHKKILKTKHLNTVLIAMNGHK